MMGGMFGGDMGQGSMKARELYIGNLPDGVPEPQLASFLNAAILQAELNTQPGMPILSVRCNGKFAFAEFRSAEEASNAMNLNGIVIVGHALNVGRPSAYKGPATQNIRWEQLMAEKIKQNPELATTAIGIAGGGAVVSSGGGGGDPATKIARELYIGNMPENCTDMGLVQFFNEELTKRGWSNSTMLGNPCMVARLNGRFAFVEFRSVEETDMALQLNGAMYNGCSLRVGRPRAYQGPPGSEGAQAANPQYPGATEAIQMANMVTIDELKDDEEYADILEDIKGEMEKHGAVAGFEVPRPPAEGEVPESCGIIYIKYTEVANAIKAKIEMEGKTFGGNDVECEFYPLDKFDAGQWIDMREEKKREEAKKAQEEAEAAALPHALPATLLGGAVM
jgi:splicing factor U2AF subunit